jgi:hypothetical protein
MAGCCRLHDTGNKILFRINWRCVNQGFHAAYLRGFSTTTTALSGQKQTLMLHLFTGPSKTLCCQRLGGHCAQFYDLVFIITPSIQGSCGDFQQLQQPSLGRSKPSRCICSLLHQKTLCCQRVGGYCAQFYDLVFIVTPSVQCTDLRGVSVGNAIIIAGGNPMNT